MGSTIYDIARLAGVSIATVSRVFNNNPKVSLATRAKVLDVASSLGYHPQAMAQSLARRKSGLITAIVPIISNYFFMEILAGMQDQLAESDFYLQISNIKNTGEVRSDSVRKEVETIFNRGMSDGYIIISIHFDDEGWAYFKKFKKPVALIDEYYTDFDSVSVNSVEGAYKATKSLITQGYNQIAMICAMADSKPVIERIAGFRKALEEAGMAFHQGLLFYGQDIERDGHTELNGYQAMLTILQSEQNFDAVFCNSDIQALGALKAMQDFNKQVPIVGFDDLSFSEFLGLSSIRQPMYKMGRIAVDKLIKRIHHHETDITHTIFSPELIKRSSSYAGDKKRLSIEKTP